MIRQSELVTFTHQLLTAQESCEYTFECGDNAADVLGACVLVLLEKRSHSQRELLVGRGVGG